MRLLGDEYIKAEFRAHRNVDNPVHIVGLFVRGLKGRATLMCMFAIGRLFDRMADVCAESGRRILDWREDRSGQDREDEWYVFCDKFVGKMLIDGG